MSGTVEAVRRELVRHIGYREKGENDTPFNREFGKLPGYPHGGFGYPWCHSFLSVCLKHAGLTPGEDFPWTAGCLTGVAWFKSRGRWGRTPRVGAFVYYGPGGGTHVEWVEQVTPSHIVTIGGNTSGSLEGRYFNGDGVYRKTIPRDSPRIYGYGYPDYTSQEDDVTPEQIWKAVWFRDGVPVPWGSKENPEWQPRSILVNHGEWLRRIDAKIDAQNATIKTLVDALAAQNAAIDADELITRIREEIGKVVVRLSVDQPAD